MSVRGRRLRDAGMSRVQQTDTPAVAAYRAAFHQEFDRLLTSGQPFNNDDIKRVIGRVPPDAHPNLAGALFNSALRQAGDRVEVAGRTEMRDDTAHARKTDLYRGAGVVERVETSSGRVITRTPRSVPKPVSTAEEFKPKTRGASSTGKGRVEDHESLQRRLAKQRARRAGATSSS